MSLPPLLRTPERRDDADYLAAAAARPDALLVPIAGSACLISAAPAATRALLLSRATLPHDDLIWLGELDGTPCFAAALAAPLEVQGGRWAELRPVLAELPADELALLALARALVHWDRGHRFCGRCGAPTQAVRGGHERRCPACAQQSFPRIDPAVIVLVADAERCLLGRQAAWPAGRFSTLAGFVEPGETLEDAVRREVLEETGVAVAAPAYVASQPWPFPASLMVGFEATPLHHAIAVDGRELEDARWFSRVDIVAGLADGTLSLSPRRAISWWLLERWFDRCGTPLAGVPGA